MNFIVYNKSKKQSFTDSIYFWGFWIILTALLVGIIERSLSESLEVVLTLIVPHVIPVFIISALFDVFFIRKRIFLFFIITIPLCYFTGLLINQWFYLVMGDANIHVNNEVLIFFFAIMFIGFRYIRIAISQQILLKEEENKRVVAELQYLRSQLNPHFLFNALNSIYSLILSQSDKAGDATLALSDLMRFHIDLSGKQLIDLSNEIEMIKHYIAFEKLKLENRCDIQFDIKGNPAGFNIPPLLFMPFVENAFKHGISSTPESNFVDVKLIIENNNIEFEISNSVAEKQNSKQDSEIKTGIDNTLKRLQLHYKNNYNFNASENNKVHLVKLKINI